ncbi:MAG: hypothetical protein HOW71_42685, partial [Nonomuraea sp.]|nr:hypothetical protein [Nonomuraea sp.]
MSEDFPADVMARGLYDRHGFRPVAVEDDGAVRMTWRSPRRPPRTAGPPAPLSSGFPAVLRVDVAEVVDRL